MSTFRGSYLYAIANPSDEDVDKRPVVLMANDNAWRTSLCNAMEDVVAIIMTRERLIQETDAVWIEISAQDPNMGQVVSYPATMPSWGPEQRVQTILQKLQQPIYPVSNENPVSP